MPRYVAFLRGINVGKSKRIAMGDLRKLLEAMGFEQVETLLNSGNAIFDAAAQSEAKLAQRIHDSVLGKLGVDALVIVKSGPNIAAIIAGNKLAKIATDHSRLLVAITNDSTGAKALGVLAKGNFEPSVVHTADGTLYAWCPEGILESKAALALLKKLADSGTTRNWATILKVHERMIREDP